MPTIRVRDRLIGDGAPCFVAAEAGINHNGDLALAHRLVDAAADAGADAIKFQNYCTEDFLSDASLRYEYVSQGRNVSEAQFDMFKRCELPPGALGELCRHAEDRKIVCFATPSGHAGVAELVREGVPLLKNGSDYLVHVELIAAMAATRLPTVLSTGMATVSEIDDAVRAFRQAGGTDLVLLHCTSTYPTPSQDVHLRKMSTLARVFGTPVGLSDHTEGCIVAAASVALGACFIEKHFTLDCQLPGPDHRFSADPAMLRDLVAAVRRVEMSLGLETPGPTAAEEPSRREYRLSCVAATDLGPGHRLSRADIAYHRPGRGFAPKDVNLLVGRSLARPLVRGELFTREHLR